MFSFHPICQCSTMLIYLIAYLFAHSHSHSHWVCVRACKYNVHIASVYDDKYAKNSMHFISHTRNILIVQCTDCVHYARSLFNFNLYVKMFLVCLNIVNCFFFFLLLNCIVLVFVCAYVIIYFENRFIPANFHLLVKKIIHFNLLLLLLV